MQSYLIFVALFIASVSALPLPQVEPVEGRQLGGLADIASLFGPLSGLGAGPLSGLGAGPLSGLGAGPLSGLGAGPLSAFGTGPLSAFGTGPLSAFGTGPLSAFDAGSFGEGRQLGIAGRPTLPIVRRTQGAPGRR